ncbi:MAG TPA: PIN domain-containing protein [Bacteroidales bacterium]|nr:PIN domain-containing protein [Bacteroidales bacterium]
MKKIFIDTDIILDLLANRKSFYLPAAQVFSLADNGKLHIHVSSLTLATLYYLLSKDSGQEKAKKILFKFKSIVTVLPVDNKTIELALSSDFKGFEDGVQYFCAIESKCSAILTRNIIGYKHSQIPVMTAESFLNIL